MPSALKTSVRASAVTSSSFCWSMSPTRTWSGGCVPGSSRPLRVHAPWGSSDDTRIRISIGVGQLRVPASLTDALHEADRELYRCKNRQKAGGILS
jgi:GGDEF domain-containing protein